MRMPPISPCPDDRPLGRTSQGLRWVFWRSATPGEALHHQPVADGVLGQRPWLDEVVEVIGAPSLRARTGEAIAAERLAAHLRAGDSAVHVQIPYRGSLLYVANGRGVAGEQAARQRNRKRLDDVHRVLDVAHALNCQHRSKDPPIANGR